MTVLMRSYVSSADPRKIIAELRRQLEERTAERDEAIAQQTATAEVLRVINSSPGDLAPVFDTILDQATRLSDAAFGVVWTYDRAAKRYRPGWVHQVPAALAEFLGGNYRVPPSGVLNVLGDASFLHVLDEAESSGYRTGASQLRRAMVDLGGARTTLAVPLRRHDTVLAIYRQEVRAFSKRQIALLQNFAQQAVMAMENARLLTETREALEQQTGNAEVLQVINSSRGDVVPVFDAMLEKAVGLCEADLGVLHTFDGEAFAFVAICGHDRQIVEQLKQLSPIRIFGLLNPIVRGERVVHVADVRKTATYRDYQNSRNRFQLANIRTWLGIALRKEDALLGVIIVVRREVRPFSDKQIALLQNFAAQAVTAMENARLLGELRQRTEEVAELNRGLEARVAEQVDELGRVGRLKRFLAPQLAELIVSQGDENMLESHRREIVVVFCDLRGYTAFTETAEPEEVLDFLREYHGMLGPLVTLNTVAYYERLMASQTRGNRLDDDLAAMAFEDLLVALRDDQLGQLRRQEPLQFPDPTQFVDLLGDARLQLPVPPGDLVGALAQFTQEPRVLHRDHCLRGKIFEQRDLLVRKRLDLPAGCGDVAEQSRVLAQRDKQQGSATSLDAGTPNGIGLLAGPLIRDMDQAFALQQAFVGGSRDSWETADAAVLRIA